MRRYYSEIPPPWKIRISIPVRQSLRHQSIISIVLLYLVLFIFPTHPMAETITERLVATPSSGSAPFAVKLDARPVIPNFGITNPHWNPGDGGNINTYPFPLPVVTYIYDTPGEYIASYTFSAQNNDWVVSTKITVTEPPLNLNPGKISIQPSEKIIFTATGGGST